MTAALVQDESVGNVASHTLGWTPSAGNYLVLTRDSATTAFNDLSSITQTNVSWSRIGSVYSTNRKSEIWIGVVSASPGTGLTFGFTGGGISTMAGAHIAEYSGLTGNVLNTATGSTGNSATPATASITPTGGASCAIIAICNSPGGVSSGPTNGFTNYPSATGNNRSAYLVVTSASGSYSTGYTYSASNAWDCLICALEATGGGSAVAEEDAYIPNRIWTPDPIVTVFQ